MLKHSDKEILNVGDVIVLKEDGFNAPYNVCTLWPTLGYLAGQERFQVDELELYRYKKVSNFI